ncbi:MAG: hypothetical protein QOJ84_1334 [Bradyrhizobium sp.]|jgi:hypothetical protein|nr:hypothetical protein [Bradyrhizobium sp.]
MAFRDYFGPIKEVRASFLGHAIFVRNSSWPAADIKNLLASEAKLYIDGKMVDSSKDFFVFKDMASLSGSIVEGGKAHLIEVYAKQRLKLRIKICANGNFIGGDEF